MRALDLVLGTAIGIGAGPVRPSHVRTVLVRLAVPLGLSLPRQSIMRTVVAAVEVRRRPVALATRLSDPLHHPRLW
eukprot:6890514-Alexandrium_andersonii.AAC.1